MIKMMYSLKYIIDSGLGKLITVVTGFRNCVAFCFCVHLCVTLLYEINLILLKGFSRIKTCSLPQQMVTSSDVPCYKTNS